MTLLVVAHHSSLAYTTFARFHPEHYLASTHPVVDSARWGFLDYAENFNDVFFMSLMFCISGLFVWPSLRRSGALRFARDRARRLGIPFIVGVIFLMPLAYYASWQLTGHSIGYFAYWRQFLSVDGRPPGPLWFIWVLLLFDMLAAGIYPWVSHNHTASARPALGVMNPVRLATMMVILCAAIYIPALAKLGFGAWRAFVTGPFYFQTSRLGLYLAWFSLGIFIGRRGIDDGLLARQGALARQWPVWAAGSLVAYNALVAIPKFLSQWTAWASLQIGLIEAILWVVSCVVSCFAFLAFFRGSIFTRRALMDSLARCAYGIYLVHYVYVLWAQRLLLGAPIHAGLKCAVTFMLATGLSWLTTRLLLKIPMVGSIL